MRVAYVCADPGVPAFGRKGASVHVQEMLAALGRAGAEVHLFARRLDGDPPAPLSAVYVHPLGPPAPGPPSEREQALLRANDEVAAQLERCGPFDLVYERHALWAYAGMEHARGHGVPGVLEVNAPLVEEQAAHRILVDRDGAESAADRAFAAATVIAAVSREVAAHLDARAAARGRVLVVPNGVDARRFRPGSWPSRPHPEFTVGFVGTLKPWHDLDTLIDAFARLRRRRPEARLTIVGEGPGRPGLEASASRLCVRESVEFTGAVDPARVPELVAGFDAAVAPYPDVRSFYFSPLKVLEYMAAGLPVAASAVGQVRELIEHEQSGLLCPPGDAPALAAALDRLAGDPALRARLGTRARERVIRDFTWDAVGARILAAAGFRSSLALVAGS